MCAIPQTLRWITLLVLFTAPMFFGCEGSEPRAKVDDTVKELSGEKNVERMKEMKKDLSAIQKGQDDRVKQLDENTEK